MKHLYLGILAALALSVPVAAQAANVTVIVNGQQMNFDQPPIEQGGRVFVPLRGVFEQLGASVVYQNGTINATGNGRTISLHIGSNQATVNGQQQTLDQAPFVEGSRTLVPLRFVAQALGASVDWNNASSTVTITGGSNDRAAAPQQTPQQPMNPNSYVIDRQPIGVTTGAMPSISAHFAVPVRRDTVHVVLDGRDVTNAVYFNNRGFQWTPQVGLFPGPHRIRVYGTTRDGAAFDTTWTFRVKF